MVTLLGSSGSLLPELTPLTWGWGGREGGWRRMAPVGGEGGGRGRRKEGRADQPAGWWISLWGFPALALSPAAAAAATTATAAAAAGAGDSTFKMAPAGLASDVTRGRSSRAGPEGRGRAGRGPGRRPEGEGRGAAGPAPGLRPFLPRPVVRPRRSGLRRSLSRALLVWSLAVPLLPSVPGPVRAPVHITVSQTLAPVPGLRGGLSRAVTVLAPGDSWDPVSLSLPCFYLK